MQLRAFAIAMAILALTTVRATAQRGREVTDTGRSASIRGTRARFNAAIASRDSTIIASLLLPSYHVVTGRSAQSHGVSEAMTTWRGLFTDSTMLYVRRPREVRTNSAWGLAEELGDWTGRFTAPDGPVRVSGSYAAKWQRDTAGRWRLQTEVFTTLACAGGPQGCRPPDPVSP